LVIWFRKEKKEDKLVYSKENKKEKSRGVLYTPSTLKRKRFYLKNRYEY